MNPLISRHQIPLELQDQYTGPDEDNWLPELATLNVFVGPNNHGKSRFLRSLFKTTPSDSIKLDFSPDFDKLPDFHKLYIPALRGARPLLEASDLYENRTVQDYFHNFNMKAHVDNGVWAATWKLVTGGTLFKQTISLTQGNEVQRKRMDDFQDYLSKTFFENKGIAIIPREKHDTGGKNDVVYVKVGSEKERPIYELGDGLQQIIILTMPLFLYRDVPLLVFVEEPELFLHPGFQRKLIDSFLDVEDSAGRQVFVATHSTQFIDITLDRNEVAVYKFSKSYEENNNVPRFKIQLSSTKDFSLLAELGIRNSSVLLANCTIWVEGITDRMYFRKYLELFQKEQERQYDEDIHYSFVEYGGNNITHWSFLDDDEGMDVDRICSNLFLIADQDEGKEERHKSLRDNLGDRFLVLPRVEIENLLSPKVICRVIESYEVKGIRLKEFDYGDYAEQRLGQFIEESILPPKDSRRKSTVGKPYRTESGTVRDKVNFAKKAVTAIHSYDDLSPDAKRITERIYDFIRANNP